jgi:hypothetical protein
MYPWFFLIYIYIPLFRYEIIYKGYFIGSPYNIFHHNGITDRYAAY